MYNINVSHFKSDITAGEEQEQRLLALIKKKYPSAYKVQGNHKQFDLSVPEVKKTVEVKFDRKSKETGNIFIECSFNGEPSGIEATTADFWIITDGEVSYWIETETLKYLIRELRCRRCTYSGVDGTTVSSFLLRRAFLDASPYVTVLAY